jgi:hypothetical protein
MRGSAATDDLEWSVLLAACSLTCSSISITDQTDRIRSLLRNPIRWNVLFQLADQHGVEPLLCQALQNLGDSIPFDEMQALRQKYQTNLHKALFLSRELIRILDRLSPIGVDVMPYKGLALAELLYGDIALRQSGDIDLLLRPQDLPRIRDAVRELGYTPHDSFTPAQERDYLKSGYEYAFDGTAGPNLLELQWAILPRFYAVDFNMAELFSRAVTISVAGRVVKTPCPEDLLLVLSAHAAKHVWGRLVWLCDIAQLVKMPSLNWDRIWQEANRRGMRRLLQVTLLAADRLLGATIPISARAHLTDDSASRLAKELQTQIAGEAPYNVESLSYFRLMMRLRERPADRFRFLARLVLTPGPGEWQAVRLPRPLFPLYRLVRLSRLAARLVRA